MTGRWTNGWMGLCLGICMGLCMGLCAPTAGAAAPRIERVEPPNWWVGMAQQELQLLIEGPGVAALKPRLLPRPGVRLLRSQPGDGAGKHLFVWLQIAPDARPGPPSKAAPAAPPAPGCCPATGRWA